mgnify:CR=1 FL=1
MEIKKNRKKGSVEAESNGGVVGAVQESSDEMQISYGIQAGKKVKDINTRSQQPLSDK